jgi:tetratricopeptide (TPR) repeat protein
LNNLASLYQAQGKYAEAEPLLQRALAIREQQLGPDHPDTATSLNNLAGLYQDQGRYAEAEPLFQQALAICEQQLGASHPTTKKVRQNYTSLIQAFSPPNEKH